MKKRDVYIICFVLLCSCLFSLNWFDKTIVNHQEEVEQNKTLSTVESTKNEIEVPPTTEKTVEQKSKSVSLATSRGELSERKPKPKVNESQEIDLGVYTLTAYCGCQKCCGKTNGITASGKKARANHTIAAPKNFAFGTRIKINGKIYVVEDRGGAIKGNRIDIYFDTHQEALNFGRQTRKIFLMK